MKRQQTPQLSAATTRRPDGRGVLTYLRVTFRDRAQGHKNILYERERNKNERPKWDAQQKGVFRSKREKQRGTALWLDVTIKNIARVILQATMVPSQRSKKRVRGKDRT